MPSPPAAPRWVTLGQAAEAAGVALLEMRQALRDGRLHGHRGRQNGHDVTLLDLDELGRVFPAAAGLELRGPSLAERGIELAPARRPEPSGGAWRGATPPGAEPPSEPGPAAPAADPVGAAGSDRGAPTADGFRAGVPVAEAPGARDADGPAEAAPVPRDGSEATAAASEVRLAVHELRERVRQARVQSDRIRDDLGQRERQLQQLLERVERDQVPRDELERLLGGERAAVEAALERARRTRRLSLGVAAVCVVGLLAVTLRPRDDRDAVHAAAPSGPTRDAGAEPGRASAPNAGAGTPWVDGLADADRWGEAVAEGARPDPGTTPAGTDPPGATNASPDPTTSVAPMSDAGPGDDGVLDPEAGESLAEANADPGSDTNTDASTDSSSRDPRTSPPGARPVAATGDGGLPSVAPSGSGLDADVPASGVGDAPSPWAVRVAEATLAALDELGPVEVPPSAREATDPVAGASGSDPQAPPVADADQSADADEDPDARPPRATSDAPPCAWHASTCAGGDLARVLGPCDGPWNPRLGAVAGTFVHRGERYCTQHLFFARDLGGRLADQRDAAAFAAGEGLPAPLVQLRVDRTAARLLRDAVGGWVESGFEGGGPDEHRLVEEAPGRWRVETWVRLLGQGDRAARQDVTLRLELGAGDRDDHLLELIGPGSR